MKKVIILAILFTLFGLTSVQAGGGPISMLKVGIDSDRDLLMIVKIPTSLDDPRLSGTTSSYSYELSCLGPDGNFFIQTNLMTRYDMQIYIPEMNFWNMNLLHMSARQVDEDTQVASQNYEDNWIKKDPVSHTGTVLVAYKYCSSGYPDWEQNYYDYEKQAQICGPIIDTGCSDDFVITGDALISLGTYSRLRTPRQ